MRVRAPGGRNRAIHGRLDVLVAGWSPTSDLQQEETVRMPPIKPGALSDEQRPLGGS
jgi:hypothetical protein